MKKVLLVWEKYDHLSIISLGISAVTLLITLSFFLFLYGKLPSRLPLFYSLPWGPSQLVAKQQFFILPTTLALITLANAFIVWQLHPAQYLLKKLLMGSLILVDIILLTTTIKIILIFI